MAKGKFIDRSGLKYGMLRVVDRAPNDGQYVMWNCICDCGESATVRTDTLTARPNGRSCGCNQGKGEKFVTHGRTKTPEYRAWLGMRVRCSEKCKSAKSRANYFDRGIRVCDRWDSSFERFLEDMGERPGGSLSIDRIDNSKGYEPGNCRWATAGEQGSNKRNNVVLEIGGEKMTLAEASRRCGVSDSALKARIDKGWSHDRAFNTPPSEIHRTRK